MQGFQDGFQAGAALGCLLSCFVLLGPLLYIMVTTPWLKCFLSGVPVSGLHILGMRLRGTPVSLVTDASIALVQSGIPFDVRRTEGAYLTAPGRIHTAADLVHLAKWGLYEANPKPIWAIDVAGLALSQPPHDRFRTPNPEP
jgi:uncharacterized protein YqfA (UPF0365 family)